MPNWCEGTLKVRGKVKDLKRFCLEGLKPVNFFGNEEEPLKLNEWGGIEIKKDCWIEHSYRGFVGKSYVDFDGDDEDTEIICLNARFAWVIEADRLAKTCKKYNVDMKIYAFERGQEFNQDVEIVNGEVTKNNVVEFDDYRWECINPEIGG